MEKGWPLQESDYDHIESVLSYTANPQQFHMARGDDAAKPGGRLVGS